MRKLKKPRKLRKVREMRDLLGILLKIHLVAETQNKEQTIPISNPSPYICPLHGSRKCQEGFSFSLTTSVKTGLDLYSPFPFLLFPPHFDIC